MAAAQSWRALELRHPDIWSLSLRRVLDLTEHELIADCDTPEEVADMAATIADPLRAARDRSRRTLALIAGVGDIG